jgi:hypothetical protein
MDIGFWREIQEEGAVGRIILKWERNIKWAIGKYGVTVWT